MLHRRAVAEDMGFHFGKDTKIIATGGASVNKSILQVIADVFNAPVYIQVISEIDFFLFLKLIHISVFNYRKLVRLLCKVLHIVQSMQNI